MFYLKIIVLYSVYLYIYLTLVTLYFFWCKVLYSGLDSRSRYPRVNDYKMSQLQMCPCLQPSHVLQTRPDSPYAAVRQIHLLLSLLMFQPSYAPSSLFMLEQTLSPEQLTLLLLLICTRIIYCLYHMIH